MDSKKLASPDQLLSQRRKVFSRFGLWAGASLSVLSLLLLSCSLKGRTVTPLFRGFNSVSVNSSLVSWPFSFSSSHSPSVSNNVSGTTQVYNSTNWVPKAAEANVLGAVLDETHAGNFAVRDKNSSFSVEGGMDQHKTPEAKIGNLTDSSGNGSALQRSHLGNYSGTVKSGSLPGEEGIVVGNLSLSGIGGLDSKKSIDGKFIENSTHVNNTVTGNNYAGNFPNNAELGRFSGRGEEEEGHSENQNSKSYKTCDIFDGRWVRDDSKPYYPAGSCPHVDRDFDCHLNGRPDDGFIKWKWQPNGCDIPSLNATDFLERLRGKKLVFVGDSLNRNMWESLVCILRHSIKNKKRVYEISGRSEFKKKGFYAFRFEDYNCTVDFVGSSFLVRESSFIRGNGTLETLRLDLMDKTTTMYHDADVIIFNTGHWWTHEKTSRGEDYYQEGNYVHPRLKVLEAYKRALKTWARWIDKNIDGNRTQIFFRGYSVTHFRGGHWNSGGQCHKETEPIFNPHYLAKYPSKMKALEHVLPELKIPVVYLNISRLTDYRKDAHPSIYRMKYKTTEEQIAAERSQDCSHWCLPGVPDTWNELLYVSLLKAGKGSWRT